MPLTIDKEKDPLYKMGVEDGERKGIRLALEIKFGGEGIMFYNRYLKDVHDIEILEKIKDKIRDAKDVGELVKVVEGK